MAGKPCHDLSQVQSQEAEKKGGLDQFLGMDLIEAEALPRTALFVPIAFVPTLDAC